MLKLKYVEGKHYKCNRFDFRTSRAYIEFRYSKCQTCANSMKCQFILDGEMLYGQEVGPGKNGGIFTYYCPKYKYKYKYARREEERIMKSLRTRMNNALTLAGIADDIRNLNEDCKVISSVYRAYSNY